MAVICLTGTATVRVAAWRAASLDISRTLSVEQPNGIQSSFILITGMDPQRVRVGGRRGYKPGFFVLKSSSLFRGPV